jgi:diguanylate cyclase (GGDEF)-like protein
MIEQSGNPVSMPLSPVIYIQAALCTTSLIIAIIFFMAWKTLGDKPWALNWSIAFVASTLYWLISLVSEQFPNHTSYWLLANAFGFAMITLALRGHCQRTNCANLPDNLWPYASLLFAGVFWTTAIQPHAGFSAAILPFACAISLFLSAVMIIRHREQTRVAEWASAITMIVFGLVQVPAALFIYKLGPDTDVVMGLMFSHASMLLLPAGYVGLAMFVIFMLASDLYEDMKEIAVRDQLTGLLNRRGFGEQAVVAYATARRTVQPVSVIAADIDHFKLVNDEFGHNVGDKALVHFSRLLTEDRRVEDIVARIGGEEFVLVLPGTDVVEATSIADELCERLEASAMAVDERKVVMTASFGVAAISDNDASLADVVIKADRALYRSKRAGRNRVDLESSQTLRTLDGTLETI